MKKIKNKTKFIKRGNQKLRHERKRAKERKIMKSLSMGEQNKRKEAIKDRVHENKARIRRAKDDKKRNVV